MKGLQIFNSDGVALSMKEVDKEICTLLGNKVSPKQYCKLVQEENFIDYHTMSFIVEGKTAKKAKILADSKLASEPNWVDTIGWLASSEGMSLDEMINYYDDTFKELEGARGLFGEEITVDFMYPIRMKIINYFKEKNYSLVGVDL